MTFHHQFPVEDLRRETKKLSYPLYPSFSTPLEVAYRGEKSKLFNMKTFRFDEATFLCSLEQPVHESLYLEVPTCVQ
jgi:hypothetical protein